MVNYLLLQKGKLLHYFSHVFFAERVQFDGEDSAIGDKKITVEESCLVLREVLKM